MQNISQCDCHENCCAYYNIITAVEVKERTARSIEIEWPQPAMRTNICGFTWEYSTRGFEEFLRKMSSSDLKSSIASTTLRNLQEGATYNITVIATPSNPLILTETLTIIAQTLPDSECCM